MSSDNGSSSALNTTEPDTTDLDKAEENKMGSGASNQKRNSGNLLREQIARQRVGTTDEGMNTRHFPAHEREDLVKQLEASREEDHCFENVKEMETSDSLLKQQSKYADEKRELLDKIKKLEREKETLNDELSQERKNAEETKVALDKASKVIDEYTRKMSHIMQLKNTGGHEDANNPFSPTKLGVKMKTVYEEQGLPLLEYFNDEVEGAKFLSSMTKSCYDICKRIAFSQMTKFCFVDSMDFDEVDEGRLRGYMRKMISEDDFEELCYLRWKTATSEEAIHSIKENVNTFSFQDEKYPHLNTEEVEKAAVKSFLQKCAETCWLIATCRPALLLRFDVENKKYERWIKQAFNVFATQKKVQSHGTPPGVIVAVVCPVLLTSDESIIMRGEVIVTDCKGNEADRNIESTQLQFDSTIS